MYEDKYALKHPITYRKKMGQFFTPRPVADLMMSWILKSNPREILDPAFGLGVFFDAFKSVLGARDICYQGIEIDPNLLKHLDLGQESHLRVDVQDYLRAECKTFDAIVCNPPYLRFQNFANRHDILPSLEKKIGRRLSGYANISSVFLVKALHELNENGRLAFVMPFEFFNTGYGKEVKRNLLETGLLKQIVLFENEGEIFPEATTTVCVLLCHKDDRLDPVKITKVESVEDVENIADIEKVFQHTISIDDLPGQNKWTTILSRLYDDFEVPNGFCALNGYGKFVRGIATGANDFFALNRSKIDAWKIRSDHYCKCITKSPQIRKAVLTTCIFDALVEDDKPVFCLDVNEGNKADVESYIKHGESLQYHQRYLTKNRNPWYKIEARESAPILFGVFNRGRLKVVRNFTDAITFTCFHSFYPNDLGAQYTNRLFVYFLSDLGQKVLMTNKRNYGANLDKFEPGDLNEGLCPSKEQLDRITEEQVLLVIETAKMNEEDAITEANRLMDLVIDR